MGTADKLHKLVDRMDRLFNRREQQQGDPEMTEFPIATCPTCWAAYRLEQWSKLELVKRDGELEHRSCVQCDGTIRADVSIADKVDLRIPRRVYAELYGKPM